MLIPEKTKYLPVPKIGKQYNFASNGTLYSGEFIKIKPHGFEEYDSLEFDVEGYGKMVVLRMETFVTNEELQAYCDKEINYWASQRAKGVL